MDEARSCDDNGFVGVDIVDDVFVEESLEKLTHNANYNQELFALARGVVQNGQQLTTKSEGLPHELKASLKDKQQQLENNIEKLAIKDADERIADEILNLIIEHPPAGMQVDH